jgi:hypothetical protein
MAAHICIPSNWEAEAGRPQLPVSPGYIARPVSKKQKKKREKGETERETACFHSLCNLRPITKYPWASNFTFIKW